MDSINSFTENLGGFFLNPKIYSFYYIENLKFLNNRKKAKLFVYLIGIFTGCVFTFFLMYPDVFWYHDSIRESPPALFILSLTDPILLIGCFLLGFMFVICFDYLLQGNITYFILKKTIQKNLKGTTIDAEKSSVKFERKNFLCIYSYTFIHTAIFHSIIVFWIYFFERFNYAKINFPVTELTIPVIIQSITLTFFVVLKLYTEYRMNQAILSYYHSYNKINALKSIIIKLIIIGISFIGIIIASNSIAAQFS